MTTVFMCTEPFRNSPIIFSTSGASFSPILTVASGAAVSWEFGDGSRSNSPAPVVDFGTAENRDNKLIVRPWSALRKINLGYDGADGGPVPGPGADTMAALEQQNVYAVSGLNLARNLEMFAASYNPLTSLDLSGLPRLTNLECYGCVSLDSIIFGSLPALARVCIEGSHVNALDFSGLPALADIRAAVLQSDAPGLTIDYGDIGAHVWHMCTHDENFNTEWALPDLSQFPLLEEFYFWSNSQTCDLTLKGAHLRQAIVNNNAWGLVTIEDSCLSSLNYVEIQDCGLSWGAVDYILTRLDMGGLSGGTVKIGGTNAAPSEGGLIHKDNLLGRGWAVLTN